MKGGTMLIHFLNEYSVLGRTGDKIRIKGAFPGIEVDDYIYLGREENGEADDEFTYRIEKIEYTNKDKNSYFGAVIIRE